MRYTLLEIVQLVLSAMDSDEVSDITDTVESYQIALIAKSVFYDLATDLNLPEHTALFQLTASGDNALPCLMTIPTTVCNIDTISYNVEESGDTYPDWKLLTYVPLDEFITMQNSLREETANVAEMAVPSNSQTFGVLCWTDRHPTYYTTFNDGTLLFDAHDVSLDTTLAAAKTQCYGSLYPTFTLTGSFAPTLDPTQFSYYINKIKVRAFYELKQQENPEAAAEARKQKITMQIRKRRTPNLTDLELAPRYGRK